jgi:hypothetical protein
LQLHFTISIKEKYMKNIFQFLFWISCLFTTTSPLHAQWIKTNLPDSVSVLTLALSGTNLFAGTDSSGIFLSTNNGTSWTAASNGLINTNTNLLNPSVYALAVSNTNLFAGTGNFIGIGGGVFLSTNNGTSWSVASNGLPYSYVYAVAVSDTNLFAGTETGGVFLSTNNGTSWTAVDSGLTNPRVQAIIVSGTNLFAGTFGGGVFLSTNNGTSWTAVNNGLTNKYVKSLAVFGMNLFAGTLGGVFFSTNNGTSWTPASTGLTNYAINTLAVSGTNLFAGTGNIAGGGGVFLSTNNGTSWTAINSGLTNSDVSALAVSGINLFAGINQVGVWQRPLSEVITSVEKPSTDLPTHFSLDQNYPNPFNPATTISFSLPSKSFISLKVFDALGREVSSLLSEELPAGTYSEQWTAAGLPSGVYFYRLQTGSYFETKKLVLLR